MNTLRDGEEDATDTALYGWLRCGVGDMPTLFSQVSAVTQDGHLYGHLIYSFIHPTAHNMKQDL